MRIGSPSVDGVLVAASLASVVLSLGFVAHTRDTSDLAAAPRTPLPALVVVGANSPSDLAVGQPVATALGGAVLAVDAKGLTAAMRRELITSRPDRVLILGGPAAVAEATASALRQYTPGSVTRLSGADRFATAAIVATSRAFTTVRHVRIVVVAAPASPVPTPDLEGTDTPVLLVNRDRIPASTAAALEELTPRSIEVLGGPDAVSDRVLQQLQAFTKP